MSQYINSHIDNVVLKNLVARHLFTFLISGISSVGKQIINKSYAYLVKGNMKACACACACAGAVCKITTSVQNKTAGHKRCSKQY
jgi:hypothetical protein